MIERVVEDWLTNVNELGYEASFAQALLAKGHTLIHQQEHGSLELGKDLITRTRDGMYHCYQLKGGNIDQTKWAKYILQCNLTVTSPIIHPSVPVGAAFRPYLVTNGVITDPVRMDIYARNVDWEKGWGRTLELIQYGSLLRMFLDLQNNFLPTKPVDFEMFLTLYLANKREPLDSAKFSLFLRSMLPVDTVQRSEVRRLLAATTIVADYIVSGYESVHNFYVATQAWTMLFAHLLRTCELLPDVYRRAWRPSIDLVLQQHRRCVRSCIDEILASANWMEGNLFVDEKVWPYRASLLVGFLSAAFISARLAGARLEDEDAVYERIMRFVPKARFWGEGAAPAFFLSAECLAERGRELLAVELCKTAIQNIVRRNRRSEKLGIPDPSYSVEEVMKAELLGEEVFKGDQTFVGRSFSIRQFVEFIVRREWRKTLEPLWHGISEIDWCEFTPSIARDSYWWQCDHGSNDSRRWDRPQSFRALAIEATSANDENLLLETEFTRLLPFFILFAPHRFTVPRARLLDILVLLQRNSEEQNGAGRPST